MEMLVRMDRGGYPGVVVLANKPHCLLKGIGADEAATNDNTRRVFIDKAHQLWNHGLGDDYESSIDGRFYASRIKPAPCRQCAKGDVCKGLEPAFLERGFAVKPCRTLTDVDIDLRETENPD